MQSDSLALKCLEMSLSQGNLSKTDIIDLAALMFDFVTARGQAPAPPSRKVKAPADKA